MAAKAEILERSERYLLVRYEGRERRVPYAAEKGKLFFGIDGACFEFSLREDSGTAHHAADVFTPELTAPMPGKVLEVRASVGDELEADAGVVLMEAMKMELTVRAAARARVIEVRVQAGANVQAGDVLAVLEEIAES